MFLLLGLMNLAGCDVETQNNSSIPKAVNDIVAARYVDHEQKIKCIVEDLQQDGKVKVFLSDPELDFDDENIMKEVNKIIDRRSLKCSFLAYRPSVPCVVISLLIMITIWACIKDFAPHLLMSLPAWTPKGRKERVADDSAYEVVVDKGKQQANREKAVKT